jgi:hypothetical protein
MLSPDIKREIRREIRTYINIIMNCNLGESTTEDQEIDQVFPNAPKMDKRPVVHPFGLVSRAPQGKLAVTAQVGEHPAARIILGVRDLNRKDIVLDEGEVCLYNEFGQKIYLKKDKIELGANATNPAVLGNELKDLLSQLIGIMKAGTLVLSTSPGNPTAPNPPIVTQLTTLETNLLNTAATNILSQETFLERTK